MVNPERSRRIRAAQIQAATVAALFVFLGAGAAVLDAAARNHRLDDYFERRRETRARSRRQFRAKTHYFRDIGDTLILAELPAADYSKGGVYLVGASNVAWATRLWELPPDQQALVHNYAIGSSSHTLQFQFLRHLIEHENLLAAGGKKTLIIFGVTYLNAGITEGGKKYFANLWQRHGFYAYSPAQGIEPIPVSPVRRFLGTERERIAGFVVAVIGDFADGLWAHVATARPRKHDSVEINNRQMRERMGPGWEDRIRTEVDEFALMVDYLHDRHVCVDVVLMPMPSWEDNLPFKARYNEEMTRVCRAAQVPVHDWSRMLDDEEFADYIHPNVQGSEKLHPAFLEIVLPHLRATGIVQ